MPSDKKNQYKILPWHILVKLLSLEKKEVGIQAEEEMNVTWKGKLCFP